MRTGRLAVLAILAALLCVGCSDTKSPAAGSSTAAPPSVAGAPASAAALASTAAPASTAEATPAATYATPEDAVTAYLAGVAKADPDAILAASAVDEISAGFEFGLYVDRLQVMMLTQSMAPASDPFYIQINKSWETYQILTRVRNLAYSLLSTEKLDGSVIPADKAKADAFAAQVDPKGLAGLTVKEVRFPLASMKNDAKYLKNMAAMAKVYGADESMERAALIALGQNTYTVGFTLLRYGNGWKVSDQYSALAGTDTLGTAKAISQADFDASVGN